MGKMFRFRHLAILVMMALLAAVLCCTGASAAVIKTGISGGTTWTLDDAGTLTFSGSGPVYSIDWDWIWEDDEEHVASAYSVKKIILQSGITYIGEEAFTDYGNVTSVSIPNTVTGIGDRAFESCSGLTAITIPGSVTHIGCEAFSGCGNLSTVTLSEGLTRIEDEAFFHCGLTSLVIPDSVREIGGFAFCGCSGLTAVTLPDSIITIGEQAFYDCSALREIKLPKLLTRIECGLFLHCNSLKTVTIQDNSVTEIEKSAFEGCENLSGLVLPNSVTSIGESAFRGCKSLSRMSFPGHLTTISQYAFEDCSGLQTITVPESLRNIGRDAFKNCYNLSAIYIPYTNSYAIEWFQGNGFTSAVISYRGQIETCEITGINDKVYTGKPIKPVPTVKYHGEKLVMDTDYTVSYRNNKQIGTAVVIITGKGDYTGSAEVTFRINPKPVSLSSVEAGKKKLTVKWAKGKSITGYEIQYSLKKNMKNAETIVISKAKTKKTTIKGLKPKKKYYVRIRAYKTVNGETYYSAWSSTMNAKTN